MERVSRRTVLIGGTVVLASGCASRLRWTGVDVSTGQEFVLTQGPMPDGASFAGNYRSPHTGDIVLVEDRGRIAGSYRDLALGIEGTLTGRVTGNAAMFEWRERLGERAYGGRGWFLLDARPHERPRLFGERTFASSGDSAPWTATRIA